MAYSPIMEGDVYNNVVREQVKKVIDDLRDLDATLERMQESTSWMDCSETDKTEVQNIHKAVQVMYVLSALTLENYFTE